MFTNNSLDNLAAYMDKNFRNLQNAVDLENPNVRESMETIIKRHILRQHFVSNATIAIRIAKVFIYLARKTYLKNLTLEMTANTVPEYSGLNAAVAPYHIY